MPKQLYALLIGIDEYPHASHLNGCVNDAKNMENYLESREDFQANIVSLKNAEATKENIVKTFREHLGQAGEEDLTLFFFAGHGVEENTEIEAFRKASATNNIQAFMCWNSNPSKQDEPASTCFADKELRYLIHELSQKGSDLYVIIDCCHSGGISRHKDKNRQFDPEAIAPRTWEGYIFHDDISRADLMTKALPQVMPEGNQVQFSACRDVELAWEHTDDDFNPGGLFSISLLKILKSNGPKITPSKIKNQLSNSLRAWGRKKQTPQFYIKSEDSYKKHKGFLGIDIPVEPFETQIVYNPMKGWVVGLGHLHGLDSKQGPVPCKVYLNAEKTEARETTLRKVMPAYSKLSPDDDWNLNKKLTYACEINIYIPPIGIFIDAEESLKTEIQTGVSNMMAEEGTEIITFQENEEEASYSVRIKESSYDITRSCDTRPLTLAVKYGSKLPIKPIFKQISHIAKWEFVRTSHNPNSSLSRGLPPECNGRPIEFSFFVTDEEGDEVPIAPSGDSLNLELPKMDEEGNNYQDFMVTITNRSKRELYVSLLHLSMSFGVVINLLEPAGVFLRPGESISTLEGSYIPVTLEQYIYQDDWAGSTEYIKLIASTSHFDLSSLELEALPVPYSDDTRGLGFKEARAARQKDDWIAYETEVFIVNPEYEK